MGIHFNFVYFMNIVILPKLVHFLLLKIKFSYDLATKPLIYFVKSFLKSHSFQETRVKSTVSCKTNRANKIILNSVAM